MITTDITGLYVHIPYCRSKCSYCDFCSLPRGGLSVPDEYVSALVEEIGGYGRDERIALSTIYFGGGTPSLLEPYQLERIMDAIRDSFRVLDSAEITSEANPGTLSEEKARTLMHLGFNRISLGLQSIHEKELKTLGRIHSYDDFLSCFSMLRRVGFSNISVDLMYGIPYQTLDSFRSTLETVTALSPEHISAYGLILEEGTPLFDRASSLPIPDDDAECDMYELCCRVLSEHGYTHYEISNYAVEGMESRHNLIYWHTDQYIGVGASAHSFYLGERFFNTSDVERYIASPLLHFSECAESDTERLCEYIMLALRLREGISLPDFEARFGVSFTAGRMPKLMRFCELGLMTLTDDRVALTERGFYLSNSLLSEII